MSRKRMLASPPCTRLLTWASTTSTSPQRRRWRGSERRTTRRSVCGFFVKKSAQKKKTPSERNKHRTLVATLLHRTSERRWLIERYCRASSRFPSSHPSQIFRSNSAVSKPCIMILINEY